MDWYTEVILYGVVAIVGLAFTIYWHIKQWRIIKGKDVAKPGRRFLTTITYDGIFDAKFNEIESFLIASGYKKIQYGNEIVF